MLLIKHIFFITETSFGRNSVISTWPDNLPFLGSRLSSLRLVFRSSRSRHIFFRSSRSRNIFFRFGLSRTLRLRDEVSLLQLFSEIERRVEGQGNELRRIGFRQTDRIVVIVAAVGVVRIGFVLILLGKN